MSEVQTDSLSHQRNASRVKRDEEELQALLKEAGVLDEDSEDKEEVVEEVSDSAQLSDAPVPPASDTEQEEKPEVEAQEEALSGEERSFKKRYSDIRKYMQEKDTEYKNEIEDLKKRLESTSKDSLKDITSKEEIEAWAKENPKANSLIRALAEEQASEKLKGLEGRVKEVEEMRTQVRKEKAEAQLLSMHPDFPTIRNDDAFHDWAKEQPSWAQTALYDEPDDVKSVSRVLDLYKSDKGIKTKKANPDKGAASSVKSRHSAVETDDPSRYLTESAVQKMSIKEYEQRADEIMKAQRSGKFIYDISKR
jgi:hypothetical protein|tara:strand:- start:202 stop:1125 length:924 start_codon:yes stop_codon:yes gene_type:complete